MKFEKTDVIIGKNKQLNRGSAEVAQVLSDFLKTDIEVAEIKDWDGTYKNVDSAYYSFKKVIDRFFNNEVRVSKQSGRLFIARLK